MKPDFALYGQACHMVQIEKNVYENPVHEILVSRYWKYECYEASDGNSIEAKYVKTIT